MDKRCTQVHSCAVSGLLKTSTPDDSKDVYGSEFYYVLHYFTETTIT